MTSLVAALWGLAEATLFFIVPDVFLSLVAVRDRRGALIACGWAVAGALAGGLVMYQWGRADPGAARAALDAVPAIGAAMIVEVERGLAATGLPALVLGPLIGTPYKIYAVAGGGLGLGLGPFLLVSVPARGVRFVLVTLVAAWVSRGPLAAWPLGRKRAVALAVWVAFYGVYLAVKWD
ncbi:MAG: hypothetical protein ACREMR_10125 [Gemmatimonadales bacterium]